jgi:hypothetical protein
MHRLLLIESVITRSSVYAVSSTSTSVLDALLDKSGPLYGYNIIHHYTERIPFAVFPHVDEVGLQSVKESSQPNWFHSKHL